MTGGMISMPPDLASSRKLKLIEGSALEKEKNEILENYNFLSVKHRFVSVTSFGLRERIEYDGEQYNDKYCQPKHSAGSQGQP
jgi:hypothetical protein